MTLGLVVAGLLALRFWTPDATLATASLVTDEGESTAAFGYGGPETATTLQMAVVPFTAKRKAPAAEILEYAVQKNDSVTRIADKFGVSPETIVWANAQLADDPDRLKVGETLRILPVSGVLHTVAQGDTLASLARLHEVDQTVISSFGWNGLRSDSVLEPGKALIVPGGRAPLPPNWLQANKVSVSTAVRVAPGSVRGTARFIWPTRGIITQKYWSGHLGIDIGAPLGTPIYASDSGVVTFAGWDKTGWGNMILIDHGNGTRTLYGHLSAFAVQAGTPVKQGQLIGRVGNTGRSTGPHLDFRIEQKGVWLNPLAVLK